MIKHAVTLPPLSSMNAWRRILPGALLATLLTGCGGGGSDTGLSGSGQPPDPVVKDIPIAYIERPLPRDDAGQLLPLTPVARDGFSPLKRPMISRRAICPVVASFFHPTAKHAAAPCCSTPTNHSTPPRAKRAMARRLCCTR